MSAVKIFTGSCPRRPGLPGRPDVEAEDARVPSAFWAMIASLMTSFLWIGPTGPRRGWAGAPCPAYLFLFPVRIPTRLQRLE